MKKILMFVLLTLVSSVYADSGYKILVGGEFGQAKGNWDDYTGEWEDSFGLRAGVETDRTRIYISYNYTKSEDFNFVNTDFESHMIVMNFGAKTDKYYGLFRGFVGGHAGVLYSLWNLGEYPPLEDEDDVNLVIGGQAGIIIDVIDNAYLEAGYRYSLTDADNDSINPGSIQTYYGAINLKF